jgi:uncharacterized membrane protein YvbJ
MSFLFNDGKYVKYCRTICKKCGKTDLDYRNIKCIHCNDYVTIVRDDNDVSGRKSVNEKIEELKQSFSKRK